MNKKNYIFIFFFITLISLVSYIFYNFSIGYINTKQKQTKNSKNTFVNDDPIIRKQIFCEGDWSAEFEKRKKGSAGYHEPEKYIGFYDNIWDANQDKQTFNVLDEKALNNIKISRYPQPSTGQIFKTAFSPRPVKLRNYLEEVSYLPVEIKVYGEGYYFFENEPYIKMISNHVYAQDSAAKKESCFNDGKREVYFNIYGYLDGNQFNLSTNAFGSYNNKISFLKSSPQYCNSFSFLTTSGSLFHICLSEKTSKEKMRYLITMFSLNEKIDEENTDKRYYELSPTLITYLDDIISPDEYKNFFNTNIDVIQNKYGEFYVFSKSKTFVIKPDDQGFLKMTEIQDNLPETIKYIVSYPNYTYTDDSDMHYVLFTYHDESNANNKVLGGVFDIEKGAFLNVDYKNCVLDTPKSFYNRTLDPFIRGPYKNLTYQKISENQMRVLQSSLNAGVVTKEGYVNLYFSGKDVTCTGEIDGTKVY